MESKGRILLGIPGYNGIVPEAQESLMRMIYRTAKDLPEFDLAVHVVTKKEQFRARNNLVDAAIGNDAEYLLMLDDDMVVPPDLLVRLCAHKKDIVGALYYQRGGAFHPVVMRRQYFNESEFGCKFLNVYDPVITNPGLHQVDIIGGGCMLFRTEVFQKITPPYFWWESLHGTDIAICNRLAEVGYDIWCDTSIEVGHVSNYRAIITSRSLPLMAREMAEVREQLWMDAIEYLCVSSEQLNSEVNKASEPVYRNNLWNMVSRDSWESVRAFYTSFGEWHIKNLLFWNINKHDHYTEYALMKAPQILPSEATVLDIGCGLGMCSIALAKAHGYRVYAVDIEESPTLDFVRWRVKKHALAAQEHVHRGIVPIGVVEPVPESDLEMQVDIALCISMLDHCFDPLGLLRWISRQIRPGGLLVCEYLHAKSQHDERNPQHLMRYDTGTLHQWLHEACGLRETPEYPWVFVKDG